MHRLFTMVGSLSMVAALVLGTVGASQGVEDGATSLTGPLPTVELPGGDEGGEQTPIGPLPTGEVRDVLGHPTSERVFVTFPNLDAVAVLDENGDFVQRIDGLPDAWHMAMDEAGETLFVTLPESRELAVVDLETGSVTRHSLPDHCPQSLDYVSGVLWMTTRCNQSAWMSFDPTNASVQVYPGNGEWIEETVADPAVPGTVFTTTDDEVRKVHLTPGEAPTIQARQPFGLGSLAVSPKGSLVGARNGLLVELRGSDLALVNQYPVLSVLGTGGSVEGVAFAPDGTLNAAYGDGRNRAAVRTFAPGESVISTIRPLTGPDRMTPRRAAVYAGDSLYVFARDSHLAPWEVFVLESPDAPASHPLGTRLLRVPHVFDVVAAPREGRTFVSTGPRGNAIFVLDEQGTVEAVLERLPGPSGMDLSENGNQLFVMLGPHTDAVAVIDTSSLRVRRIPLTLPGLWPRSLALGSDLLWFNNNSDANLPESGALDPTDGTTLTVAPFEHNGGHLYTSPLHPGLLYDLDIDYSWEGSVALQRAEASNAPARELIRQRSVGAGARELDFTPDGLHVVVAAAGRDTHSVLHPSTLEVAGDPYTDNGPAAVAIRSDGLTAYGAANNHNLPGYDGGPDTSRRIDVRRSVWGRSVARVNEADRYFSDLVSRGVAFGRRDLYAVFGTADDYLVKRARMPALYRITASTDRQRYARGDRAKVVAHVSRRVHERVRFTQVGPNGRKVDLGWRRVDRHGNASVTVAARKNTRVVGTVRLAGKRWTHAAPLLVN